MNERQTQTTNKNGIVNDDGCFVDGVIRRLCQISSDLHDLFSDFIISPVSVCLDTGLTRLQQETKILCKNIEFLIGSQLHGAQRAMTDLHTEFVALQLKYENLQSEWDGQQEHLGRMQSEVYKLRNQMQQQSQFCASLGAVMGNLVWKASRIPPVVDILLSGNKVGDFLSIVNGSLISFMETYGSAMPGQCADESQFIMSMCGIVTNMAAAPAGRQFLVNSSSGKDLLTQFGKSLSAIPAPSGNCLKRLLLMAMYNTSINQNGLKLLQKQNDLISALTEELKSNTTYELRLMTLRLLQSLTYEINCPGVFQDISENLKFEVLKPMLSCSEPEMKNVVQEIMNNMCKAKKKFDKKTSSSPGGEWKSKPKCPGACGEPIPQPMNKAAKDKECATDCPAPPRCCKKRTSCV